MFERGQNIGENRRGGRSAPTTVNSSVRTREYLTTAEIERLMAAARKSSRYGHRDATMILIGYRHGLRASELCDLQWSQVELTTRRLHVRRAKNVSAGGHRGPCVPRPASPVLDHASNRRAALRLRFCTNLWATRRQRASAFHRLSTK